MPSSRPPRERRCVSVIQACSLFQTIGGTVQSAKNASAAYKPGRRNSLRHRGVSARTSKIETNSNALVYLHKNPSPTSKPVSGHHHEKLGLRSSASQNANIAPAQKKIESGSIVMKKLPMLKSGVTLSAITPQKPAASLKSLRVK